MTDKLTFFKKFCIVKKLEHKFAFGKIVDGKPMLVFLNGETSENLAYDGGKLKDGVLYGTTSATCGYGDDGSNKCNVGKPNKDCVDKKIYSKNKCAVYFFDTVVNLETFIFPITLSEFYEIDKLIKEDNRNSYQMQILNNLTKNQKKFMETLITNLGEEFSETSKISSASISDDILVNNGLAKVTQDNVFVMLEVPEWWKNAFEIWLEEENTSSSMADDFIYWYATTKMNVGYVESSITKINSLAFDSNDYWEKYNKVLNNLKEQA